MRLDLSEVSDVLRMMAEYFCIACIDLKYWHLRTSESPTTMFATKSHSYCCTGETVTNILNGLRASK